MAYAYNFIEHTADIAFEAQGDSIEELFTAAASGWRYTVLEDAVLNIKDYKNITLKESSTEELLVYFIDELNFLLNTKGWVFSSVKEIKVQQSELLWKLDAVLGGEPLSNNLYDIKIEIKAVTFHQMSIQFIGGKYRTKVVFDI